MGGSGDGILGNSRARREEARHEIKTTSAGERGDDDTSGVNLGEASEIGRETPHRGLRVDLHEVVETVAPDIDGICMESRS